MNKSPHDFFGDRGVCVLLVDNLVIVLTLVCIASYGAPLSWKPHRLLSGCWENAVVGDGD